MAMARQQFRSGFTGIEILLVVIILVVIFAVLAKPGNQTASGGKQSSTPNEVAGNARAIAESARAARAVTGLMRQGSGDEPPAAAPALDPTDTDPVSGDGLDDILDDIFDGF
jgi:type II secretory pathway pseudopilin PulG